MTAKQECAEGAGGDRGLATAGHKRRNTAWVVQGLQELCPCTLSPEALPLRDSCIASAAVEGTNASCPRAGTSDSCQWGSGKLLNSGKGNQNACTSHRSCQTESSLGQKGLPQTLKVASRLAISWVGRACAMTLMASCTAKGFGGWATVHMCKRWGDRTWVVQALPTQMLFHQQLRDRSCRLEPSNVSSRYLLDLVHLDLLRTTARGTAVEVARRTKAIYLGKVAALTYQTGRIAQFALLHARAGCGSGNGSASSQLSRNSCYIARQPTIGQ